MSDAKSGLRATLRAARRVRPDDDRATAAEALRDRVLALPALTARSDSGTLRVAVYLSTPDEPGTGPLIEALVAAGHEVLVPVLLPDFDLDWTLVTGADSQLLTSYVPSSVAGRGRILEPDGVRLGPDAIAAAELVVVPGLAVDNTGRRLGQGGGSYDRALLRVRPDVPIVALLFDDEILDDVAAEAHDYVVTHAVTPSGTFVFGSSV